MPRYTVTWEATTGYQLEVEAESEAEAIKKVEDSEISTAEADINYEHFNNFEVKKHD